MVVNFDIRHIFIIVASEVNECSGIINDLYETNEEKYFNLYLNSGFRDDILIDSLSYEGQKKSIKLVGILEEAHSTKNFYIVEKIISAYNRRITRYFKKGKRNIDECCKEMVSIEKSEFDMLVPLVFSMYYCKVNNINCDISKDRYEVLINKWNEYTNIVNNSYLTKYVGRVTELKEADKTLSIQEERYGIDVFKECYLTKTVDLIKSEGSVTIDNLIDNVLYEYELDIINKEGLKFKSNQEYRTFRNNLFDEVPLFKKVGNMTLILRYHGLNYFSLANTRKIDLKQLKILLISTISRIETNQYDIKDLLIMFVDTIYFNTILIDYITVKNHLLNKSEVKRFEELNKLESQLNKRQESLEGNIEKYSKTISETKSELKEIKGQFKKLSSDNTALTKEITNLKSKEEVLLNEIEELKAKLNREITAGKNSLELDTVEIEEVSIEEKIKYLNEKNISIIGGANNIKNILSILPNVFLFNEKNKDATALLKYDFIFINSDFISHSLVFKINSLNINYNYISGTNLDLMIDTMYKLVKKSEI